MKERLLEVVTVGLVIVIAGALFYTQVIRFDRYLKLSKNNVIRIIPIDAPRGRIFDRNGKVVVTDRVSFDVAVVYQELRDRARFFALLADIAGIARPDAAAALEKARLRPYAPVTVVEDIAKDKAIALEEASVDVRGLVIETSSRRSYLYNDVASHIVGYLSEVSEEELEGLREYGYRPGDLIGRDGLEKQYDMYLAGADGGMQIQVDNRGRQKKVLGFKEPSSGKDLYLSLDMVLQSACDRLLGDKTGAVIAMDPRTGDILALASHPAFDPNLFVTAGTSDERMKLITDTKGRPLSNRAISASYPPGSVFKVVTASGALETDRISPETTYVCNGSLSLGAASFDCWKADGHGPQNVTDALMNSCNVFFYNAGRIEGGDTLETYARAFGFGRVTGIDLPDEVRGVVPGKMWKRLHRREEWYEGDSINYSIGQGYLLTTPIQVLTMMAAVANGGYLVRPHIVKQIGTRVVAGVTAKQIGLKDRTLRVIKEGLYNAINRSEGTAKRARIDGVAIAGKTGTAQTPHGRTHGWFAGFAPYRNPRLCLVVFLEHGGKGGLEPAEIAKGVFEEAKARGYL